MLLRRRNERRCGARTLPSGWGTDLAEGRSPPRRLRVNPLRALLVEAPLATEEETERHLANVVAGRLDLAQPPLVLARGGRP